VTLQQFEKCAGAYSDGDDDADAALEAEMTDRLNFGGGFVRKAPGDAATEGGVGDERHRTKKEVRVNNCSRDSPLRRVGVATTREGTSRSRDNNVHHSSAVRPLERAPECTHTSAGWCSS